MAWAVLGMVVYAIGSAGLAYLIKPIFDSVLPKQQEVGVIAWAIVAVYLLKGIGSYVSSYLMADVGQRVVMDLRNALYRHILDQSAGFFAHGATGRLLSRINNDVGQVQQAVSETAGDLARESLALVGYAALLFYYDARLTIVCFTGAPLIVYPLIRLGQRVRRTTRRSQEAIEQLSHLGTEAFTGHRIVKAFATETHETEKFKRAGYHLFRTNMKVTAALSSLPPLMELIGGFGMAGALVYGSSQIASNNLTPGQFVLFIGTLLLMYGPAKKLSRVNADIQQALAASERIFEMLDTHTEVVEAPNAEALTPFRRTIELRDVAFGYEDGSARILRNVSLVVRTGQMIAIVGRSGAGKTTLVNLLPRFYDVSGGAILIDGVDIRQVTVASLRQQIGIVTQDTVLFDDSIRGNIAYGSPRATTEQIEAAARRQRPRLHQRAAGRLRHDDRRARPAAVRRAASADCDCARHPERRTDPRAGRGDVRARHRVRAAGTGSAVESDAEPHVVRDRAPPVDHPPRGCDRRARARQHRGGRAARRSAGEGRRQIRVVVSVTAARVAQSREDQNGPVVTPSQRLL
jgi:subfamily B ATP-binding cassette protein MsbA